MHITTNPRGCGLFILIFFEYSSIIRKYRRAQTELIDAELSLVSAAIKMCLVTLVQLHELSFLTTTAGEDETPEDNPENNKCEAVDVAPSVGLPAPEHEAAGQPAHENEAAAKPTTAEPATAEPATAEPTTAEPTTAEPATAEPAKAEPTTAEPATAEPTTTEPTTAEPATVEPAQRGPVT